MGADTSFQPYLSPMGDPCIREYRGGKGIASLPLHVAQALHHELGQAIAEAQSMARRFEYQVASVENEAEQ